MKIKRNFDTNLDLVVFICTNLWRNPNKLQLIRGNINRSTGYLLPVAYLSQPVATAPLTMQQPKGAVATG